MQANPRQVHTMEDNVGFPRGKFKQPRFTQRGFPECRFTQYRLTQVYAMQVYRTRVEFRVEVRKPEVWKCANKNKQIFKPERTLKKPLNLKNPGTCLRHPEFYSFASQKSHNQKQFFSCFFLQNDKQTNQTYETPEIHSLSKASERTFLISKKQEKPYFKETRKTLG